MGPPPPRRRPRLTPRAKAATPLRYVLANWKMYPTIQQALVLVETIQAALRERARAGAMLPRVIICPPFVSLAPLRTAVDRELLRLGAQTCHWLQEGPCTGEISPEMLRGLVDYVLVGHSERRATGETDEQVARKVAAVAQAKLVPILFVGEDEPGPDAMAQVERRLRVGLSEVDVRNQAIIVVYEPSWAIGGDQAAPAGDVGRVVAHLKALLVEMGMPKPEVLYGGAVGEDGIDGLADIEVLDGVGATRAGLQPERLLRIVDRLGQRRAEPHEDVSCDPGGEMR